PRALQVWGGGPAPWGTSPAVTEATNRRSGGAKTPPACNDPEIESVGLKWFSSTKKRAPFSSVRRPTDSTKEGRALAVERRLTLLPPPAARRNPTPSEERCPL